MSRKKTANNPKTLAVGLMITLIPLCIGLLAVDGMEAARLPSGLLFPLARMLFFVAIGLVAAQAIESTRWTEKLGCLSGPMFRYANLGSCCSAAFTAAFFSGVSANAMLLGFYREESITKRQLFLTNLMNQFPAYFLHLPMTFFIVTPLTRSAGVLYFVLTFLANVLRTVMFVLFGHFFMKPQTNGKEWENSQEPPHAKISRKKEKPFWPSVKGKLPGQFIRVVAYVVPIYTVVYVLTAAGAFESLEGLMTGFAVETIIPVKSLSVVVLSFISEFTAGFAAAGALMDAGSITVKQTVIALLLGNIIAFPIRAIRHQLPRYMGIFSPVMGLQMLLMGQGFRMLSLIFVGMVYWIVG